MNLLFIKIISLSLNHLRLLVIIKVVFLTPLQRFLTFGTELALYECKSPRKWQTSSGRKGELL